MTRRARLRLGVGVLAFVGVGLVVLFSSPAWLRQGFSQSAGRGGQDTLPVAAGTAVICSGEADVEGGILPLAPTAPGRVTELLVREGQRVRQGTPLLRLDAEVAKAQLAQAEANVRVAELHVGSARQGKKEHAALLDKLALSIRAARLRAEMHKTQVVRLQEHFALKLVNKHEVESAEKEQAIFAIALEEELARERQAKTVDSDLPVRIAQAQLDAAQAAQHVAKQQLERCVLTASADGVVLRVTAQPGQVYSGVSAEPAVWLRPDRPWVIRCEIDQQYIDRVEVGMPCDIANEGSDRADWQGVVLSKGEWVTLRRPRADDPFGRRDQRVVECLIRVPCPQALRIGQRVRVVIRTGHSPL
jgi:HlyD family secretion protein